MIDLAQRLKDLDPWTPGGGIHLRFALEARAACTRGHYKLLNGEDRSNVLNTLYNYAPPGNELHNEFGRIALQVQCSDRHYQLVEAFENKKLKQLNKALKDDAIFNQGMMNWRGLSLEERIQTLQIAEKTYAALFGFESGDIITFERYRAGEAAAIRHKSVPPDEPIKEFHGRERDFIALNISETSPLYRLSDAESALRAVIHERTHLNDYALDDMRDNMPPTHPYHDFVKGLDLRHSSWYYGSDLYVKDRFYISSLSERHARAVEGKFRALREGRSIPRELRLLRDHIKF